MTVPFRAFIIKIFTIVVCEKRYFLYIELVFYCPALSSRVTRGNSPSSSVMFFICIYDSVFMAGSTSYPGVFMFISRNIYAEYRCSRNNTNKVRVYRHGLFMFVALLSQHKIYIYLIQFLLVHVYINVFYLHKHTCNALLYTDVHI